MIDKFQPEYGIMKQSGVGQYVRLYDYRTLEGEVDKLQKEIEELKEKLAEYENSVCIENLEV